MKIWNASDVVWREHVFVSWGNWCCNDPVLHNCSIGPYWTDPWNPGEGGPPGGPFDPCPFVRGGLCGSLCGFHNVSGSYSDDGFVNNCGSHGKSNSFIEESDSVVAVVLLIDLGRSVPF